MKILITPKGFHAPQCLSFWLQERSLDILLREYHICHDPLSPSAMTVTILTSIVHAGPGLHTSPFTKSSICQLPAFTTNARPLSYIHTNFGILGGLFLRRSSVLRGNLDDVTSSQIRLYHTGFKSQVGNFKRPSTSFLPSIAVTTVVQNTAFHSATPVFSKSPSPSPPSMSSKASMDNPEVNSNLFNPRQVPTLGYTIQNIFISLATVASASASLFVTVFVVLPISFMRTMAPRKYLQAPGSAALADKNKVVLIVGASRGIGFNVLKQYANDPDTVIIAASKSIGIHFTRACACLCSYMRDRIDQEVCY